MSERNSHLFGEEISTENAHSLTALRVYAHSDQFGHLFQSISDTDSDGYRTGLGAKRRSGFSHKKVSDISQGCTPSGKALEAPEGRRLLRPTTAFIAPSIRAGGRAAATSFRATARVAAGRYA